jgi:hypothetical protein
MARKKQSNKSWLGRLVFFIAFPLIVWFAAFFLWFHWHDLSRWFADDTPRQQTPKAGQGGDKGERRGGGPAEQAKSERPQEKILEEERRKLEDIIERRN